VGRQAGVTADSRKEGLSVSGPTQDEEPDTTSDGSSHSWASTSKFSVARSIWSSLTLTTESDSSKRDEGKKLGATGWLVKPISGQDLVKVIRQVLPGS
jgi:hypothetical protein